MKEKSISLKQLKSILNEKYFGKLPLAFTSAVVHPRKENFKPYIEVQNFQTSKFEKFETNQIGYHKPISKSINYNSK